MISEPSAANEPHRPAAPQGRATGARNAGDAWVAGPDGQRYWGKYGAAGLLAVDPERGILLQHRASWSHYGDTWALPGGARHEGESAAAAALREAAEEAGVPAASIRVRMMSVLDLGVWTYATLIGDVTVPFEPVISDAESHAVAWVPPDEVQALPLHPAFARSWRWLRPLLDIRPGVVVEGQARKVAGPEDPDPLVRLARADGSGDDAVVAEVEQLLSGGRSVTAVTSDRGLGDRCRSAGARVIGAGRLRMYFAAGRQQ